MDTEYFKAMEVKPKEKRYYLVTLFQFRKEEPEHPDYFTDWLEFDGNNWAYGQYEGNSYVCIIHEQYGEKT